MNRNLFFLLPSLPKTPAGGYKIAYQYADFFANLGYKVHLVYPYAKSDFLSNKTYSFLFRLKTFIGFYYRNFRNQLDFSYWYQFKNQITNHIVFSLSPKFINKLFSPDSIIFATAVQTAYDAFNIKKTPDKNKFYLIQDFENWNGKSDDFVYNSYKLPLTKIVISKWLQKEVEKAGSTATIIPNGLNFDYFKLTTPISERKPTEIAMLYHTDERKRCCDSMAALDIVKKQIPDLHVSIFGTPDKPKDLPEWYSYYKTPDQETHNKIYNDAAIFVAASEREGWALPPAEAMQCGAALACTEIGVFSDYAVNEKYALLSPVYDVKALADNILRLIQNNDLRIKLAKDGNNFIQQFTQENANSKIKELVETTIY